MVDNFEIIKPLLAFEKEGDCYYLQLLRRQSDDPMVDGNPDPNYHGNMHSRSIKDYFVPSIEYLEQKEYEIKELCKTFNVRAYIRLNKRNYKKIALHMLKHIAEQEISGQTFSSPTHLLSSAAGLANCASKKTKSWIVDCDNEHLPHLSKIEEILSSRELYDSNSLSGVIAKIQTKSGIHLIVHPFNREKFDKAWSKYVLDKNLTAPLPQYSIKDGKSMHFSLSGVYLPIAVCFVELCKENGGRVKIDKSDKNKMIVHVYDSSFLALEESWKDFCNRSEFFLLPPDIHQDNPTILYVP